MSTADTGRPHPFTLVFGAAREERFPAIRAELRNATDVQAFVLAAPALELLRELRPDQGLGDAVDDFVSFVHAAYLFWCDGETTISLDERATRGLCESGVGARRPAPGASGTRYIQIAPHLIWGQLEDEEPFEPLDGWFATHCGEQLRMVACFGVHAQRPGVSIVCVDGSPDRIMERPDGSPPFAPTMPGGNAADLHAVMTPDELLLLGWRAVADGEDVAP